MFKIRNPIITGYMKRIVVRENGVVETEGCTNSVGSELKLKLNDALRADTDYAMDNLQTNTPSQGATHDVTEQTWGGKDFIVVGDGSGALQAAEGGTQNKGFGLVMVASSQPTSTSTLFTGEISGYAITIPDEDEVQIGVNWAGQGGFVTNYAEPTSWTSLTLAVGDSLTIEWTFTIS